MQVDGPHLTVRDDGPGIEREVQARMFEPFFSTKSVGEGTGLGLAITRKLLREIGARLEIQTSPAGSEFRVCFTEVPVRAAAEGG